MDVEGILAFAERVLPSASNLWVQSSLNQKQRLQQLFLPDGMRFRREEGCWNRDNAPGFQLLRLCFGAEKRFGGPDRRQLEPCRNVVAPSGGFAQCGQLPSLKLRDCRLCRL
jgi:hypothetical protein